MNTTQKIVPTLWFDTQAEEAAAFYTATFTHTRIVRTMRYDESSAQASGQPVGSVLTVEFEIEGQQFIALNGGPVFHFTPAISFVVYCETQEEIDRLWSVLSAVPEAEQCGWLTDKYGVSWQIVPTILTDMVTDSDTVKAGRVMQAMLEMKKLDIARLRAAYDA